MTPTKEDIERWVMALRSGKYKQGAGELQSKVGHYCCLGVACKEFIPKRDLCLRDDNTLTGSMPANQPSSPLWLDEVDALFFQLTEVPLPILNDGTFLATDSSYARSLADLGAFTFDEIADLLEAVFIHKVLQ